MTISNNVLHIRRSALNDLDGIYQMVCLLEECEFDRTEFERIYRNMLKEPERYVMLLAFQDDEPVAYLGMRMEELLHHNAKVCEILEFLVLPTTRSQGIGHRVFEYACQFAKDQGCVQIELSSNMRRLRAHAFYERQGMTKDHFNFTMPL